MIAAIASLLGARSFKHGIHPQGHKEETEHLRVERMPFTGRYVMPLSQHAGAPSRPVVRAGERVERGQLIAEPGGFVSTTLHSPVTGTVTAIGPGHHPTGKLVDAIEIEANRFATQRLEARPVADLAGAFDRRIRRPGTASRAGRHGWCRVSHPRQVQAAGGQEDTPA